MYYYPRIRGTVFIFMGALLLFVVAGDIIVRLLLGIVALYLINYGLRLRGFPPTHTMAYSWFDQLYW